MILETQQFQVTYTKKDEQYMVGNFQEIGRAWKQLPFKLYRAALLNQVCNGVFDTDDDYGFYMERDVVKEFRLDYEGGKGKDDIVKMVTRRKAELVKNINCSISQTHGLKLRKIRTKQ